ncbi:transcriptional repressor [Pseudomonas sp. RW10S2]|uniref:Fur family transcriptional regulator n=1 Tax=Pseudomonas sp. RW10S2 TaxID=459637 RepID=UPI0016461193|nr:transcriptional repressor [Pseudomonas sp. RW10S2]MBC3466868.1 transcriptional repressor [Pseudomonas sp. RW10S2]
MTAHNRCAEPARPSLYPAILRVFEGALDLPLSAEDVYRRYRAQDGKAGPAAFDRALNALKAAGLLKVVHLAAGAAGYELDDEPTHDRLICSLCGRVQRFDDAELHACRQRIAARHGFDVVGATHVIYAHCRQPDCSHFQGRTMTLR